MRRHYLPCAFLVAVCLVPASNAQQPKAERIPLKKDYVLRPGYKYQSLLLLEGKKLTVLTGNGLVAKTHDLDKSYLRIGERADVFVALSADAKALDLLDKNTLKVKKTVALKPGLPFFNVQDLAVHPTKPISYVSIMYETRAPGYRVLIVDEAAGVTAMPEQMYGQYLAVTSDGQKLFVGYHDIGPKGFKLPVAGGKMLLQSYLGDVNALFGYALEGDKATPKLKQIVDKVGGNGRGLVVSPDGARIAYLSVLGNPAGSGNLIAYGTKSLTKEAPVSYALKNIALTSNLSFHPTEKLAAAPGVGEPAILCDRESGSVLKEHLKYQAKDFNAVTVHQVAFSPDGNHIVLGCTDDRTQAPFLYAVELTRAK